MLVGPVDGRGGVPIGSNGVRLLRQTEQVVLIGQGGAAVGGSLASIFASKIRVDAA